MSTEKLTLIWVDEAGATESQEVESDAPELTDALGFQLVEPRENLALVELQSIDND